LSGGILFELGIHAVDLQCYLMGPPKELVGAIAHYDPTLNFTTSISAITEFEGGVGVLDLRWFSSSNFFHNYVSGSVADAIIKFLPDGLIVQRSDFSPLSELTGEFRRLWNFGYAVLRRKHSYKTMFAHKVLIEDFVKCLEADADPLVPISSVIPTIRLAENIRSRIGK